VKHRNKATERRNYVIDEMVENNIITADQGLLAKAVPLVMTTRESDVVRAPYFAEEIRRELESRYGVQALYQGGLSVRSTIDPTLQTIAEDTLRRGLLDYDIKQGYRGPYRHIKYPDAGWADELADTKMPPGLLPTWRLALVQTVAAQKATIAFDLKPAVHYRLNI
jgi:penicillin-binding protein 1A